MSAAQAHLDEAKDEGKKQLSTISTQLSLGGQLALQMAKFGPILAFRINARTLMALPWGLVSAGAAGTATGVDGGDPTGVARMTAIMVKMGLLNFVHDIVVKLGTLDRSDVTAAVTLGLLNLGEIGVVMQINNALIASKHMAEGAEISKEMLKNGQMQFLDLLKKAGGEWLGGDGKDDGNKKEGSDDKGSWFGKTSSKPDNKDEDKHGEKNEGQASKQQQGSSWFGSSGNEAKQDHSKQEPSQQNAGPSKYPATVDSVADKVAASINSAAQAVMPVKPNEQGKNQIAGERQQHGASSSHQEEPETRTL